MKNSSYFWARGGWGEEGGRGGEISGGKSDMRASSQTCYRFGTNIYKNKYFSQLRTGKQIFYKINLKQSLVCQVMQRVLLSFRK